jgi:hypothetical protein
MLVRCSAKSKPLVSSNVTIILRAAENNLFPLRPVSTVILLIVLLPSACGVEAGESTVGLAVPGLGDNEYDGGGTNVGGDARQWSTQLLPCPRRSMGLAS